MLFTLPGVPSVYYGSEWGIKGEKTAASDADVRPYIDIEHIQPEEPALEEHIKKLNHIRNNNEVLCHGSYRQVYIQYQKPLIYERNYNGKNAVIAVNIRDEEDTVDIRQFGRDFYDVLNDEHISAGSLQSLQIPPHWGRILL
jgi:glycosidase